MAIYYKIIYILLILVPFNKMSGQNVDSLVKIIDKYVDEIWLIDEDSIRTMTEGGKIRKNFKVLGIKTPFFVDGGFSSSDSNYRGKLLHSHFGYSFKRSRYDFNEYYQDGLLILSIEEYSKTNKKKKTFESIKNIKKYYVDSKLVLTKSY